MERSVSLQLLVVEQDSAGRLIYRCQPRTLRLPLEREERVAALRRLAPLPGQLPTSAQ